MSMIYRHGSLLDKLRLRSRPKSMAHEVYFAVITMASISAQAEWLVAPARQFADFGVEFGQSRALRSSTSGRITQCLRAPSPRPAPSRPIDEFCYRLRLSVDHTSRWASMSVVEVDATSSKFDSRMPEVARRRPSSSSAGRPNDCRRPAEPGARSNSFDSRNADGSPEHRHGRDTDAFPGPAHCRFGSSSPLTRPPRAMLA